MTVDAVTRELECVRYVCVKNVSVTDAVIARSLLAELFECSLVPSFLNRSFAADRYIIIITLNTVYTSLPPQLSEVTVALIQDDKETSLYLCAALKDTHPPS